MKVLVCVKRVPMTGGRIVLTDDGLAIETGAVIYTSYISPGHRTHSLPVAHRAGHRRHP